MAQVRYPYIDLSVVEDVRPHVLASHGAVLFSSDLQQIFWANGEGSQLIGPVHTSKSDMNRLNPSILRQIQMAVEQLDDEDKVSATMRVQRGIKTQMLPFTVQELKIGRSKSAILLVSADLHGKNHGIKDKAQMAVDCLEASSRASAILDNKGELVAASKQFSALKVSKPTVQNMVATLKSTKTLTVKDVVKTKSGDLPVGLARLADGLHLLIIADENDQAPISKKQPAKSTTKPVKKTAKKPVKKAEPLVQEDAAPTVGAFTSKRIKSDEKGLGRWYYKPVATEEPAEEAPKAAKKPVAKPATEKKSKTVKPQVAKTKRAAAKVTISKAKAAAPKKIVVKKSAARKVAPEKATPKAPAKTKAILVQEVEHTTPRGDINFTKEQTAPTIDSPVIDDGFEFSAGAQPIRFVWEMDADTCFISVSDELAIALGPLTSNLAGASWHDVCTHLNIQEEAEISDLLAKGDTWSGKTVLWPVQGADLRVPVDLAGLPSFGRNRKFAGFNGIGVIRTADAVVDPEGTGLQLKDRPSRPTVALVSEPTIVAQQETRPAIAKSLAAKSLSNDERDAFDVIGEQLGERAGKLRELSQGRPATAGNKPPENKTPNKPVRTPQHDVDTSILAKLPISVLVYRDQDLLFGNQDFFTLTGYQDLSALAKAGGIDVLFGAIDEETLAQSTRIFHRDGTRLDVQPNLQMVPWDNDRAMLLTLRREDRGDGPDVKPDDEADNDGRSRGKAARSTSGKNNTRQIPANGATLSMDLNGSVGFGNLSNDDLRGILDTASDGVIVMDKSGIIKAMNRSAEALFDTATHDAINKPMTQFLAQESHKITQDYLSTLGGTSVASMLNDGREVIGRTAQGGLIPLFMTIGKLSDDDVRCAVLKDITQWKKTEEELLSSKRLAEQASQQKSDFLAQVSHEIRTPLNAVIGFSDIMIEERFGKIENDRYHGYLRDIHRSGEHVLTLINDLLDISKIEAGEIDLDFDACDLNTIVSETVALSQPQANNQRVIIRTSLSAIVPKVVADPRSLRQIILNLVSNGIKFTEAGGQVIVSTVYNENGEVVLRVRDTGQGMSVEEVTKALQPFAQIRRINSDVQEGTGLGLPLTKAMVEANRASFHIESEPEEGTLIEIFFPSQRVLADR